MSEIQLQAQASSSGSRAKPQPTTFLYDPNITFSYDPSPDGVDSNLLILLHGRGDSEHPFSRLGRNLALPQTATLALRGPQIVPLLEEHEREWWSETDMLGMNITNPNPSPAIKLFCAIVQELTEEPYHWASQDIHVFGFGQGGTLACEAAREYHQRSKGKSPEHPTALGSIVSTHGPLLSLPTSGSTKTPTPVLYVHRPPTSADAKSQIEALRRGFTKVDTAGLQGARAEIAMPKNKEEWHPVMKFWSEVLRKRSAWELNGEVYEVTGSVHQVPAPESVRIPNKPSADTISSPAPAPATTDNGAQKPVTKTAPGGMRRGFLSKGL